MAATIEKLPKGGAVYRITNTFTGDFYVGKTLTLRKRWAQHQSILRTGRHTSKLMQEHWFKYGESAFVLDILELADDRLKLYFYENREIDALAPTYNKIYVPDRRALRVRRLLHEIEAGGKSGDFTINRDDYVWVVSELAQTIDFGPNREEHYHHPLWRGR